MSLFIVYFQRVSKLMYVCLCVNKWLKMFCSENHMKQISFCLKKTLMAGLTNSFCNSLDCDFGQVTSSFFASATFGLHWPWSVIRSGAHL